MTDHDDYWFPAKRYGWGWGLPTKWQGWAILVGWVAMIGAAGTRLMPHRPGLFLAVTLLLSLLLLLICFAKGEPPRWRWGD
jgi:hypothetical protein